MHTHATDFVDKHAMHIAYIVSDKIIGYEKQ
jgi:hypothetical protein